MAGKIHALATRGWPKGRDWYDLVWYRSQRPPVSPNLVLLQNALGQTEGSGAWDAADWPRHIVARLQALDIMAMARDVRPFLDRPQDAALLTRDNILSVLEPPSPTSWSG
jgi:hypothetical protein